MLTRKKSLRDYSRDKKLREGKPLFTPSPAKGLKRKGAAGRPSKPQEGSQPARKLRVGLKRVSSKRAKENRIYTEQRKAFLVANPFCQIRTANCAYPATDIHHRAGRAGSMFLDESQWMPACRNCHEWCHQNPNTARQLGFLAPRGA